MQRDFAFTATIHSNNSAELVGSTLTSETAFSVSTLPSMISKDLVSGLKLESNSSPRLYL
ncbi:hypothetical protein AGABI1DRAFT_134709 [Agaricus bisporus var. burnettii JB137-S8]|uniref:Uncharacterized protein n=1 Tax=Agaricus bisporus var. burnettii (strain JB137-S8 / ATCC MYA-4627 / FGSC 10392) TaxID=597362 RepID=K5VGK4_AGABU|nr:uncharacterized protein AGABI1DRAFT_134709 [Agaricus bisporus var. burnettii JB137-S8]EKM73474.1 hypothetical protein AGABI1DRAFT_134709 [Agaricus bisporus var. burnettii JB137-S8]